MDRKVIIVIVAIVVTAVAWALVSKYLKNRIMKRLLIDLKEGKFDDYYNTIDKMVCKLYFPPFNREYMRMNGLVMEGKKERVEEQFDLMLQMRLGKKQEVDIVMKAYYYYLEDENKKKAKLLLERVRKFGEDYYNESKVMYDVYLDKSTKYINEMEEALLDPECKDTNRGMFLYMLGIQYGNDGQKKKMTDYLHKAQPFLKNTPYEIKIRALLK